MAATRFPASRCRLSILFVVIVVVVGLTAASSAAKSTAVKAGDSVPPTTPGALTLEGATETNLTVTWTASRDNRVVVGYDVGVGGKRVGTTRNRRFTVAALACGQSYLVTVVAVDRAGNRSKPSAAMASTLACMDTSPPATPTGFRQVFTTASSVVVSWSPSADDVGVVGYSILDAGLRVATTSEPRFTFEGLTCGASRSYGVDAVDAAGNHSPAAVLVVRAAACTDTTPPSSPAPVSVVDASQSAVSIAWPTSSDNVGVDHYNVYRGAVKTGEASTTSSTVGGLACGTTYTLGVDAEDVAGNASSVAGVVAATRPCSTGGGDTQPPSVPSALAVSSATQTSLSISWSKSTDNIGVTQYTVYVDGTARGATSSPAYSVQGLSCGKSYDVAVDASDAAGNRSQKTKAYLSTSACTDVIPPSSPASVTSASRSQTSISLLWSPSSDNVGVAGYGVYRSGARVAQTSETKFTVTGLTCGTDYSLGVDSYDGSGNRSSIATVRIGTSACGDTTPPSAPANVTASSVAASSLSLSWGASTDNVGVAGYDVFRNGVKVGSATALSSAQSGLSCGTSYQFGVVAYDAAGNRSPQGSVTVSTLSCTGDTKITSSVNNGDAIAEGAVWTVTTQPAASRVEFWADGSMIADDTTAPFSTNVNLPTGSHSLGLCVWVGGVRQCQSTVSSGVFAVVSVMSSTPALQISSGANVWVDANGGTCQRSATTAAYGDAAACGSLPAAQAAASPGDVVRVKGGSYGNVTLTADKGSPAVVFKPADGESPSFGTLTIATGAGWITLDGLAMDSFLVGPTITGPGGTPPAAAHDVRFVNVDANTFMVNRAERVAISGGDYGPANSRKPTIAVSNPWDTYAPTDVTVENARFHDITMDEGGEHVECILVYAGDRVAIRGNTFSHCEGTGDVAVMYLRVPGYKPSLSNVSVVGNTFSSDGNAGVDPTAAYFNVQADRCIPGLQIQDNVAPKGIYYTSDC